MKKNLVKNSGNCKFPSLTMFSSDIWLIADIPNKIAMSTGFTGMIEKGASDVINAWHLPIFLIQYYSKRTKTME